MKRIVCALSLLIVFALPTDIFGRGFKVYPGAKLEDVYQAKQSEAGSKPSKVAKVIVFTTNDSFENVVSFYRGIGREYRVPGAGGKPMKLPSGQEFREAYFIFDDAGDIMTSKHWIKIQRPYLGIGQPGTGIHGKYTDAREVTAIIEEDRRTYP